MWFKLKKETKELPPLRNIKEEVVSPRPLETEKKIETEKLETEVRKTETFSEPPLFIKLDKYRELVNSIAQLKALTQMIKNSVTALEQLQKTQMETLTMIRKTLGSVEQKINKINNRLIKPPIMPLIPTIPEYSEEYQEVESINATVANLKTQIEQLKEELSSFK